ncbi:MAG: O-antigen ligase family protein [Crocinitomicaceae bacterium]
MVDHIKNYLERISIGLLSIIVFLFPIHQKIISPFIVLWIVFTVTYLILIKPKFTFSKSFLGLLVFYFFLIIGLLWTDNLDSGIFDLEVKLSLAIFPLFMLFLQYELKSIKWIIYAFFLGLLIGSFILLFGATERFLMYPSYTYYFYIQLSDHIHPTYMSLYYAVAIGIILADLSRVKTLFFKNKVLAVLIVSYFSVYNFLLLSKVGIIATLLIILVFLVRWSIINQRILYLASVMLLIGIVSYTSYEKSSYFKQRMNELVSGLIVSDKNPNNGSTGIRLQIWGESTHLIKEKPIFGYGTGDVKDVLVNQYNKVGMIKASETSLNAHNQFFQIAISLGLTGLLLFIFILYEAVKTGIKNHNVFIVNFVLLFCLFFITESMLETQAGTIFFGLFFSLLSQKALTEK